MIRVLPLIVLLLVAVLVFAWGLGLVVTADQDTEGVRGTVGWIFLVFGLLLGGASSWALMRTRRR